jgi:hypothetical protein
VLNRLKNSIEFRYGLFSMRKGPCAASRWKPVRQLRVCNAAAAEAANTCNRWLKFPRSMRCWDRKIVFLAGTTAGTASRTCTTDKAKTFLVPLIKFECSEAEDNGTTFEELRACAKGIADDFTDLTLVVDGQAVTNLDRLRVQAESTFTSVDGNGFGIPAATDSKFAADGYWALVKLTPGEHTLTFGGSYPPGNFTTSVTYDLFVKK